MVQFSPQKRQGDSNNKENRYTATENTACYSNLKSCYAVIASKWYNKMMTNCRLHKKICRFVAFYFKHAFPPANCLETARFWKNCWKTDQSLCYISTREIEQYYKTLEFLPVIYIQILEIEIFLIIDTTKWPICHLDCRKWFCIRKVITSFYSNNQLFMSTTPDSFRLINSLCNLLAHSIDAKTLESQNTYSRFPRRFLIPFSLLIIRTNNIFDVKLHN